MKEPLPGPRQGRTIWFTGLSGAGKTTLAGALAAYLHHLGIENEVVDGDEIRQEFSRDLGFAREDREENIYRFGYLARLLNRHGITALVAAISPYREARNAVRRRLKSLEVHVDCPLELLIHRDVKGLYRRALGGEITSFSGLSDPYEPPLMPDIYVNSAIQTERESLSAIIRKLEQLQWIPIGTPPHHPASPQSLSTSTSFVVPCEGEHPQSPPPARG